MELLRKRPEVPTGVYRCRLCNADIEVGFDLVDSLKAGDASWLCHVERHEIAPSANPMRTFIHNEAVLEGLTR